MPNDYNVEPSGRAMWKIRPFKSKRFFPKILGNDIV